MKLLMIGGTGTISLAITQMAAQTGVEVTLLNRGQHTREVPNNVRILHGDINDEAAVAKLLENEHFDAVADFIAFLPAHVERDIRLFTGKTNQYVFISSASAYQKPLSHYLINEATPMANPYWQYSRDKIACEELLMKAYRDEGFPVTLVRPSHTYGDYSVPMAVHGEKGGWQVIQRMRQGKPVIVHGDGLSLWTLTHNLDFAKGFLGLLDNRHAIGEAVHITSDETLTWNDIYELTGRALGVKPEIVHISSDFLASWEPSLRGGLIGDKANSVVFDNAKLKRLVPGFAATIRFDQGVRSTLDFVLSHPECQTPDLEFDAWCDKVIAAYRGAMGPAKD